MTLEIEPTEFGGRDIIIVDEDGDFLTIRLRREPESPAGMWTTMAGEPAGTRVLIENAELIEMTELLMTHLGLGDISTLRVSVDPLIEPEVTE